MLPTVSQLGSGTRAIGVYPQRWARPSGRCCVALWGVGDPGNVGTVIRSALAFGASLASRSARAAPTRTVAQGRARLDGRAVLRARRARAHLAELPGRKIALVAREGAPLASSVDGDVTLVVGAEREGLPVQTSSPRATTSPTSRSPTPTP